MECPTKTLCQILILTERKNVKIPRLQSPEENNSNNAKVRKKNNDKIRSIKTDKILIRKTLKCPIYRCIK